MKKFEVMLIKSSHKEVQKNRNKLKPIADTVILSERLNISFIDDSQYRPNIGKYLSGGLGKFTECLGYRVWDGDIKLGNRLKTCSKNSSYISKTSRMS